MLFLTPWFFVFAGLTFPVYWLVRARSARLACLLVFSVLFHTHFAGPAGVLPIIAVGIVTYLAGLTRNRVACVAAIVLSIASLVFYKYTRFLCLYMVEWAWCDAGSGLLNCAEPLLPLAPPLAISFFVFEFIHYLVEVSRGGPSIRSPLQFALFALFWPSIVAGPVKRYGQFLPALHEGIQDVRKRDVAAGIILVAIGILKKLAADSLTAYIAFHEVRLATDSLPTRWAVFLSLGLRILWDFSGYSDMAIGFALMFGVRLPANFNWPYLAVSIRDFWQRWHISLSSWIRDYVYIPIGGSRHGPGRKLANGLLAFAICGLWHGAAWNFLVWGLYHGAGLAVSGNYRKLGRPGQALSNWLIRHQAVSWGATMLFVNVGWLFFFYPVPAAVDILRLLFQARS